MPAVQEEKKRLSSKHVRKFRRGHWLKRLQAWSHRYHAIRNELRRKGLFVTPGHGIVRRSKRVYGVALLGEEEPFVLPSLGYSGPTEVKAILRRAVAENMWNLEETVRKVLKQEFDARKLATEASVKAVDEKVTAVDQKVMTVAEGVERLRVLVENRLH